MHTDYILTEDNLWANEEGTPILAQVMSDAGVIPTRNWSTGTFDGIEGINSDSFLKLRTKNRACYQCAIGCRQFHEAGGVKAEGPEYETIALCGANCGIGGHRGPHEVQRPLRRMGPGHHLLGQRDRPGDGPHRAGRARLRPALRRRRGATSRCPS